MRTLCGYHFWYMTMPSLAKSTVHAPKKLLTFTRHNQDRDQRSHANRNHNDNLSLNVHAAKDAPLQKHVCQESWHVGEPFLSL